ncbi:MAG: MmcQ/YjbR family DNA-binding protein [Actinomycetota bacterium]|nr:MmcQ/YjbR family DNA-binding protein [Actinomycetota bacterium]
MLGLDGATERSHQGNPDFRYNGRNVVNLDEDAHTITIKLDIAEQRALVEAAPDAYSLPGGWARHGWTTTSLDRADSQEIRELVEQAWEQARTRPRCRLDKTQTLLEYSNGVGICEGPATTSDDGGGPRRRA